ncbi:MAG TPA: cell division protein FtsA [Anaerolineae bacterium]|nr:cell division protein FtsA [Anaerolineae bacterium]
MTAQRTIVGIDVGTTKICALVGESGPDGALRIVGVGLSPSRGIKRGVVVNVGEATEAIGAALEKAERSSGYQIARAFVSLAGTHINAVNSRGVVAVVHGERGISQEDVDRAIEAARAIAIPADREVLHVIPRGFTVDGQDGVRDPIGMTGFRLEVEAHIVTGATSSVHNLLKCIEGANVAVDALVLSSIASGEAVLTETEKDMGVALADIGGGTTDIAIFIDGSVWHTTILGVGGSHITNDVAVGLRLPADAAENVKVAHGHARYQTIDPVETIEVEGFDDGGASRVVRRDVAEIIEARAEEIFNLIMQEVKRSGYDGLLPAGLVLSGGTAQLRGLRELGRQVMNMPVRVGGPHDLLGLVDTISTPAFATSVGLLKWGDRQSDALARTRRSGPSVGRRLGRFLRSLLPDRGGT